jgi:VWFA-related protein
MPWRCLILLVLLRLAVGGEASAQSRPSDAVARTPVTWVIFVDDLHLQFRNTGRIRDAVRAAAKELIQEGDRFAIASSGPSALAIDLTTDRQVLDAAVKKITGNGLRFEDIQTPNGAAEARYRASTALSTAQSMLDNLSRAPAGPTALVYVSNGYSVELLPDRVPGSRPLGRLPEATNAEIREQRARLTETARRANVRIFAIDRRSRDLDAVLSGAEWQAHEEEMRRVLRVMAEASGGFVIVSDLVTRLTQVAATMQLR